MAVPEFERRHALERLAGEVFDVLVVGGGVTGCGVALDAATRGLRTALVEARDFGSGTSSKSSKLIHGGLRYLQQHDYLLVYQALHERQRLLRNAPHLVHPLPFLIPLFGKDGVVAKSVAKAYSSALWLYDVTGGVRIGKKHRRIQPDEALAHFPALRTDRLVASFLYWDAQADDARLTLALARTAAAKGAVLANYSPVASLVEEDGRVRGARLQDGTLVRARTVVNAGGVWAENVGRLAPSGDDGVSIRPAKGIHVTVRSDKLPCDFAAVLTVPGDRRSVFVVPWAADEASGPAAPGRFTYIGTTDTDYDGPLDDPVCTAEDVAYVLDAVNAWTSAGLTPQDVTATWAGLRPLISDAHSARTADLSRRHRVLVSRQGLVTVTGGKLTTYREMAADTVDAVLGAPVRSGLGRLRRRSDIPRSRTSRLTLVGGEGGGRPPASSAATARELGVTDAVFAHLGGRHGSETAEVLGLCTGRPELARRLHPALPYLEAEVVWAARQEMAMTVNDVLARRTRALILDRAAAVEAAPRVAALLAEELSLDPAEQQRQVAEFVELVEGELASEGVSGSRPAVSQ
ncbi:MAG TPA: glycerol-3-phosphate dehydrogenase/oxidase [Acidimicrobiales bacterium]|nr:glycerol-3-phosphate dehydrogenase/oxidase [Acidimicrobiales bacterium]